MYQKPATKDEEVCDYSLRVNSGTQREHYTVLITDDSLLFQNGYYEQRVRVRSEDLRDKLALAYILAEDPDNANGFYNVFTRKTISMGDIAKHKDTLGFKRSTDGKEVISIDDITDDEIFLIERRLKVETLINSHSEN